MSLAHATLPRGTAVSAPAGETSACDYTEADEDRPVAPKHAAPVAMLQAIPCMRVASIARAFDFYTKVLGFARRGVMDAHQVRLFRGVPGARGTDAHGRLSQGVHVVLRTPQVVDSMACGEPARAHAVPGVLWLQVTSTDGLFAEVAKRMATATTAQHGYFPEADYAAARIASKPHNTAWGTREFEVADPDGNMLVFCEDRM
ncbi:hypothetical protein MSPP1_000534 [Malassezia sp. CBS 17886]|nr:hypothetical protein MSPP1_000534 [Malassezia sp. CBS 17886]